MTDRIVDPQAIKDDTVDETEVFDLIVVGCGPAGSAAAITAAKRGLRVLIRGCYLPINLAHATDR